MDKMKKADWFLIYITVVIGIALLRISKGYPYGLVQFLNSFVELAGNIIEYFGLTKIFYILQNIPIKWLLFFVAGIQMAIGFLALYLFRSVWEQGTMILLKKGNTVLKTGITLYIMIVAVIAIFIYSIVGLPIGGIMILLTHIAVSFGRIPIMIFLGYLLLQQFCIKGEIYLYYMIGSFVMLLFLYYFVYQCRLPVEFEQKHKFDRKKMRDIIKKDL